MNHPKVIAMKNIPSRLPVISTVVWWLLMDRLHASQLAWGITGTIAAIVWIVAIFAVCLQESTELKELAQSDRGEKR